MPPLDFPPGTPGATYTGPNGTTWSWDGAKWLAGTSANVYAPISSPVFTGDPQVPQPSPGDSDATIPTTKFVSDAVATSLHDVGRNYLHNGLFTIQQRGGGPWNSVASQAYTADRWQVALTTDGVNVTLVPCDDAVRAAVGDQQASTMLVVAVTGSAAATAYSDIGQPIEGLRRLSGKTVTLSFWAASGGGAIKLGVNYLLDYGTGGSPSPMAWSSATGQSVTLGGWARYSVTTTIASAAGKTTGTNNNDCTRLGLFFSSGANNNAVAGNIGVQTGSFYIWGIQLELGPTATPLEKLDPVTQLQQCQRFYCTGVFQYLGYNTAASTCGTVLTFPVSMRNTPTIIPTTTFNNNCAVAAFGFNYPNQWTATTTATATGAVNLQGTYTASADL